MYRRWGWLAAGLVAVCVMAAVSTGARTAEAADKVVTLNPNFGPVGTVVTAELSNAPANDFITVIFKIPGDPVLTTGTTDANGHAIFTFTIPYTPGAGTWPVFFTDFKCSCQIAVDFTITQGRATPVPTATPTSPPASATPTRTATPQGTLPATPTSTATATPTPRVPVAGTGGPPGPHGPNIGILALGFLAVVVVLSWFAATRRGPGGMAFALAPNDDLGPDYSTDLDFATLDSLRRTTRVDTPRRESGFVWAVGAAAAAVAGFVLLRRK